MYPTLYVLRPSLRVHFSFLLSLPSQLNYEANDTSLEIPNMELFESEHSALKYNLVVSQKPATKPTQG